MCLLAPSSPASTPEEDLPAPDRGAALLELQELGKKTAVARNETHRRRAALLQEAEAGAPAAARLFEEALKAVEFEGRRDQSFPAWKNRQGDILRSGQFQKAVQMHARYLALSLKRAQTPDNPDHAESSWAYAQDLAAMLTQRDFLAGLEPASREVLLQPIHKSILTRWLMAEQDLPAADAWEAQPGAIDGILESNIRPAWRKSRDPRLMATWDLQLQLAEQLATENQPPRAAENFALMTKPSMLFRRAQDIATLGQPNRAAAETLKVIRQYPAHPDTPRWIEQLRQWLGEDTGTGSSETP